MAALESRLIISMSLISLTASATIGQLSRLTDSTPLLSRWSQRSGRIQNSP